MPSLASRARDQYELPPVNGVGYGGGRQYNTQHASPTQTWDPSSTTLSKPPLYNARVEPVAEEDLVNHPRYRDGAVTPPPTPEEAKFLADDGGIPWDKLRTKEFWLKKKTISTYRHCRHRWALESWMGFFVARADRPT